jgi:ABC-type phosphate/phosphonate transport system substrate-binding protein
MKLNRRDFLALLAALTTSRLGQAEPSESTLKFGVVPYLTARRLATLYEPVRGFFESELSQPVRLLSAPDYSTHLDRLRAYEYDLVADSLPVARLAQRELGYIPLARTMVPLQPVIVVAADSPVKKLDDLRNKTVVASDRIAALTIVGLRYLRDNGLQPNKDVTVRIAGSHANAIQRVLAGDAVAAIVSHTTLKQIEPALASRVKVFQELPQALSAVVYAASPRLAAKTKSLSPALINFAMKDPAGKAFIESLGHQGLLPVGKEMVQVDALVVEFYRQLGLKE